MYLQYLRQLAEGDLPEYGDKGGSVLTVGAHNLSFSKKNLRITPDPDFRHFRNVLV